MFFLILSESSIQIQLAVILIFTFLGFYLRISFDDWIIQIFLSGFVLSIEAKYRLDKWGELVPHEHWHIKEPFSADENREAQLKHYRIIRDEISKYVIELIKRITDNT